jgi:hypothetical protein
MPSRGSTPAQSPRSSSRLSQLSGRGSSLGAYTPLGSSRDSTPRRRTPSGHHVLPKGPPRRTPNGKHLYCRYDLSAPTYSEAPAPVFRPIPEGSDQEGAASAPCSRTSSRELCDLGDAVPSFASDAVLSVLSAVDSVPSRTRSSSLPSLDWGTSTEVSCDVSTGSINSRRHTPSVPHSHSGSGRVSRTSSGQFSRTGSGQVSRTSSGQFSRTGSGISRTSSSSSTRAADREVVDLDDLGTECFKRIGKPTFD